MKANSISILNAPVIDELAIASEIAIDAFGMLFWSALVLFWLKAVA